MIWDDLRFIFMIVVLGFLFPFAMVSGFVMADYVICNKLNFCDAVMERTTSQTDHRPLRRVVLWFIIVTHKQRLMISNELLNQLQQLTQSIDLLPSVESAIHNLMISARNEGYEQGYDDGDDDGYNRGTIDGRNYGINMVRSGILGD